SPPPVAEPAPPRPAPVPVPVATAPRRPEPAALPPADNPPRTGLWIVLGLLVVALLVAGFFLVQDSLFPDSPERTPVPDTIGMTEQQARTAIGQAGLTVREPVTLVNSDTVAAGDVIDQDPQGDDFVDPGSEITLTVSIGREEVEVPDVTGKSVKDAVARLQAAGFTTIRKTEDESDRPAREVLTQSPAGGEMVAKDTAITITYSDGPEKVPTLVGRDVDVATQLIEAAGFVADVRDGEETSVRADAGKVTDQAQAPDTTLPEGSVVTIFVTVYVEPTSPPTTEPPTTPPTTLPTDPTSPTVPTP
ncbi:PASTA domain-containing protein, partial [Nocardioides sp.]|uniref:PASTA domain-containing protein n=1 Tax=Nocardioides sp. TaxID=35761 RepID=UPI00271D7305